MSDTTILREKRPAVAEFVDSWRAQYEKEYDFSDETEKATFYEGVMVMARHVAENADAASLASMVNNDGVSQLIANATPQSSD